MSYSSKLMEYNDSIVSPLGRLTTMVWSSVVVCGTRVTSVSRSSVSVVPESIAILCAMLVSVVKKLVSLLRTGMSSSVVFLVTTPPYHFLPSNPLMLQGPMAVFIAGVYDTSFFIWWHAVPRWDFWYPCSKQ